MLPLTIPPREMYNSRTNEFIQFPGAKLQLEHSLVSISKWESKWCEAFLETPHKTDEQLIDYVRCMTITQNVNPLAYRCLTPQNLKDIKNYIDAPMTASYVRPDNKKKGPKEEKVTSELIYYWMIDLGIPFECEKWHLNRLMMLIRICNRKGTPPKKRSAAEIMRDNAALNAARKKRMGSRG